MSYRGSRVQNRPHRARWRTKKGSQTECAVPGFSLGSWERPRDPTTYNTSSKPSLCHVRSADISLRTRPPKSMYSSSCSISKSW